MKEPYCLIRLSKFGPVLLLCGSIATRLTTYSVSFRIGKLRTWEEANIPPIPAVCLAASWFPKHWLEAPGASRAEKTKKRGDLVNQICALYPMDRLTITEFPVESDPYALTALTVVRFNPESLRGRPMASRLLVAPSWLPSLRLLLVRQSQKLPRCPNRQQYCKSRIIGNPSQNAGMSVVSSDSVELP